MKKSISKRTQSQHKVLLVEPDVNIIALFAHSNYTEIVRMDSISKIMAYPLGSYAVYLSNRFIRINRSTIVNKSFVKKLNYESRIITLSNGTDFPISRRRWISTKNEMAS